MIFSVMSLRRCGDLLPRSANNGAARVEFAPGCPRRSGTCFAYPDRRTVLLIPLVRQFFISCGNPRFGNKMRQVAVYLMSPGVEGKDLDVLDLQERARFEQLVLPHLDAAFNLARWILRGRADAEDVAQEAMLRAFRFFR